MSQASVAAGVNSIVKSDGHAVAIVQRIIAAQNGPVIPVGHPDGGAVITEAGNDPNIAALVYVAAFAPDKGESVSALIVYLSRPEAAAPIIEAAWRVSHD
jgi:hypothetical protein